MGLSGAIPSTRSLVLAFSLGLAGWSNVVRGAEPPPIDFARDVYPVFQRSCFECHGPKQQKGKLRLDLRESAFHKPDIIAKGDAAKSELFRRITLPKGHDDVMPNRGEPLTAAEVKRIQTWINTGANWPDHITPALHWAYVPPKRPALPPVPGNASYRIENEVDRFVVARLAQEHLAQSPEAPRATLIRRLWLDLIGLPPSPADVDSFLKDTDPCAYEKRVEQLLASPEFGVRWARPWLDYARYADSHGFQRDDLRDLWPYRDWVVNALNADMPFDQFTVEQLAGDLLPNATLAQKIATGFNRSAPTNVEAGTDPEETRVNQVLDRVNTVGMVWLGSTLECCQCHDHKYDPFTQNDYYGLFAYFNNTALEADRTNPKAPGSIQFKGPSMALPDPEIEAQRRELQGQLTEVGRQISSLEKSQSGDTSAWEDGLKKSLAEAPQEHPLEIVSFESTGGAKHVILPDHSVLLSGDPVPDKDTYLIEAHTHLTDIRGIKLEALTDDSLPGKGPGRGDAARPNFVLSRFEVSTAPLGVKAEAVDVRFASATASFSQPLFPVTNLLKKATAAKGGAWAIAPRFHQPHWAVFQTAEPLGDERGLVLRFRLQQNFGAGRVIGRVRLSVIAGNVGGAAVPGEVVKALSTPPAQRTPAQIKSLADYRLQQNPEHVQLTSRKTDLEKQLLKLKGPTTLVMEENTPRDSAIFMRGDFRSRGSAVKAHVPAVLRTSPPSPGDNPAPTRLDLARWLASPGNPLVARVTVNRWWSELFGHGLVSTPEDFGIKGEAPTHPELLDWLAVEFMERGWSMKKLLKTLVMSATYRQSSRITPELLARDDQNHFYARGPRFRLDAEAIRDNALAISGLLSVKHEGPPIHPYQPAGLWAKVGGQQYDYQVSPGEDAYRRGLYIVWKRAAPYPSMVNFDANARLACRVKRVRSNTPLQALTLMNDPVYVEAALAFAKRVLTEKPDASPEERLTYAFRVATARAPQPPELAALRRLLEAERSAAGADPAQSAALTKGKTLPTGITTAEFAAWYAVTTALLNLDETISKG